jgi:hypothetical protein
MVRIARVSQRETPSVWAGVSAEIWWWSCELFQYDLEVQQH